MSVPAILPEPSSQQHAPATSRQAAQGPAHGKAGSSGFDRFLQADEDTARAPDIPSDTQARATPGRSPSSADNANSAPTTVVGEGDGTAEQPAAVDGSALAGEPAFWVAAVEQAAALVVAGKADPVPVDVPARMGEAGALGRWFAAMTAASDPQDVVPAGQLRPAMTGLPLANGKAEGSEAEGLPHTGSRHAAATASAASAPSATASLTAAGRMAQTDGMPSFAQALAQANLTWDGHADFDMTSIARAASAVAGAGEQLQPLPASAGTAPTTLTTGAQSAATALPQGATGQAVPLTALAVEIHRQASAGRTQFDIRLDPPELGRLTVRLEMDAAGHVRTHLIVERGETLDMLTADARSLERALNQTGLKADPGSLSFELAHDAAGSDAGGFGHAGAGSQGEDGSDAGGDSAEPMTASAFHGNEDGERVDTATLVARALVTGQLDVRI